MRRLTTLLVAVALLAAVTPAGAANREHEQMMADIRMLQEQNQRLQLALTALNETLKALNTKLDDQGAATRKGFADQKLLIDGATGDLRVLREKLDETNVRLTSLSQDVDGLRDLVHQASQAPPVVPGTTDATGQTTPPTTTPGTTAPPPTGAAAIGTTPRRLYETAYADYTAGQWSLAVQGFETYLKTFPKSDLADDAQYLHRRGPDGRQQVQGSRRSVRARDHRLSAERHPAGGVLQGGQCVRAARAARQGARGVRVCHQAFWRDPGSDAFEAAARRSQPAGPLRRRFFAAVDAAITKGQGRDG